MTLCLAHDVIRLAHPRRNSSLGICAVYLMAIVCGAIQKRSLSNLHCDVEASDVVCALPIIDGQKQFSICRCSKLQMAPDQKRFPLVQAADERPIFCADQGALYIAAGALRLAIRTAVADVFATPSVGGAGRGNDYSLARADLHTTIDPAGIGGYVDVEDVCGWREGRRAGGDWNGRRGAELTACWTMAVVVCPAGVGLGAMVAG